MWGLVNDKKSTRKRKMSIRRGGVQEVTNMREKHQGPNNEVLININSPNLVRPSDIPITSKFPRFIEEKRLLEVELIIEKEEHVMA